MKNSTFSQIRALGINVWREAIRDKVLHVLAGSGMILMIFSLALGQMSVGGQNRVLQNTGFWILGMWGLATVVYLGSNILKREIQNKTVYLILSRPVSRPVFLLGKYIGMLMVCLTLLTLLTSGWFLLLGLKGIAVTSGHLWAVFFIFGEWMLLAAFSLFFASFTTPLLHNFFIVGIAFLGHWSNDIKIFSENANDILIKKLLICIYYLIPNLEAVNFREAALYGTPLEYALMAEGAFVVCCWIGLALFSANAVFYQRRLL